jgi:hypothetical protein
LRLWILREAGVRFFPFPQTAGPNAIIPDVLKPFPEIPLFRTRNAAIGKGKESAGNPIIGYETFLS